ncbi:hypothetical protein [Sphingomonas sp.]|uniref:hypothetical protein n=1 Tax=Sphingomonas sp. TaxID=28214 RepID=UPI00181F6923|nr:hypothetical protein [Sphingomonas sp.]MBA3512251.1 hypothetical protein [Sphingomonas sp.]
MTMMKLLAGAAGLAALATAAPATAQWGYAQPQGYAYGYNNMHNITSVAAQRCSAAVQHRLSRQTTSGVGGIVGALLGVNTAPAGRVLAVTQAIPRRSTVRVRGLATSGRSAGYGPYGAGAYGGLGYAYQPDLSFSCDVDYRGFVRDVDINRRR